MKRPWVQTQELVRPALIVSRQLGVVGGSLSQFPLNRSPISSIARFDTIGRHLHFAVGGRQNSALRELTAMEDLQELARSRSIIVNGSRRRGLIGLLRLAITFKVQLIRYRVGGRQTIGA